MDEQKHGLQEGTSSTNDESESGSVNTSPAHEYRMLGESGMYEDEDGNIYSSTELFGSHDESIHSPSHLSAPDISRTFYPNSDEPDWAFLYDPRYCGPSREDYIERMHVKYIKDHPQEKQKSTERVQPRHTVVSSIPPILSGGEKKVSSCNGLTPSDGSGQRLSQSQSRKPLQETESLSTDEDKANASADSNTNNSPPVTYRYPKRTIVFLIVGAFFLIFYFCLLIYNLIRQIIHLFEI